MRIAVLAVCAALALMIVPGAHAQQKEIKIGFIYDVTGPFAGGGSEPAQVGTKAIVDYFNERGGVAGYKINAIFADAQSKVDVAINEMTRLIDQEKVDIISGVYSSAQCVPMVQQADARKKFTWLNVCVATAVFKDRKLNYVFRPQAHSDQFGAWSCDYINYYAKSKFGVEPKNLRVAIIHEDGPYGVGVAAGQREGLLTSGDVPQRRRLVAAAGQDDVPAGADGLDLPRDGTHPVVTPVRVPYPDRPVLLAGADDPLAVLVEGHARDGTRVPQERGRLTAAEGRCAGRSAVPIGMRATWRAFAVSTTATSSPRRSTV